MKRLKSFLGAVATLFAGMLTSSLLFIETDDWKIYLPVCLLALSLNSQLKE